MYLQPNKFNKIHLSHFHNYISAYETTPENVEFVEKMIRAAVKQAKETKEGIIVDQDSLDHIFIVWPSGTISLYREVGQYNIIEET